MVVMYSSGCDNCEEWYHGDCIGITELNARTIKRYYCTFCRREYTLIYFRLQVLLHIIHIALNFTVVKLL